MSEKKTVRLSVLDLAPFRKARLRAMPSIIRWRWRVRLKPLAFIATGWPNTTT